MYKKIPAVLATGILLLTACSTAENTDGGMTLSELEAKQASASHITQTKATAETETVNEEKQEQPQVTEEIEKTETDEAAKEEAAIQENKESQTATDLSQYPKENGKYVITWDEFFDNEKQDTPSNKFWDLKGEEVVINGFMGEVLSLSGGWFLLIPAPGAECPFDNGDESYWNKIMICFVEDKKSLRYTGDKPLRVTGRLDVGVKVDESNYKTMFRLYDTKIEQIQ